MSFKINYNIIIYKLLISYIFSYVTFPLFNDTGNITGNSPKEIIEKLLNSKLYIIVNIGSEKVDVKCQLLPNREEFMIAGENIKNHKYNESNSKSYNCSNCAIKYFDGCIYSEGIISTEDLNIQSNNKDIDILHNINFILGTKSKDENPPKGFVGLLLSYYDTYRDYNLIINLRNLNITNSYFWHLNFDNEPKMVIGGFPHDLDNKKYNSEKFFNVYTIKTGYYIYYGLSFTHIYYDNIINTELSLDKNAVIRFDYGLVSAPNETGIILEKKFFEEFYTNNICFKEILKSKEYFIYCRNTKEFDIKKFKSIYFKSFDLDIIFELKNEDLFFYKGDYVYFLIVFKGNSWTFGELFLKKYYLTFNQDQKTIGYYKSIEYEESYEDNEQKININLIFIIIVLMIIILLLGIVLYNKSGKRKNRTNELDDSFEYKESINNIEDENDNKKIF